MRLFSYAFDMFQSTFNSFFSFSTSWKSIEKSSILWYDIKAIGIIGDKMKLLTTLITKDDIPLLANAGADGLILGTAFFSVRSAGIFKEAELAELAVLCHAHKMEMRVLVNRMFNDDELPQLKKHLYLLKEIGTDAIYFSDEAVLAIAEELNMKQLLIYQSDTLLTNHIDADYYLAEGLKGVVLAKEITLAEITAIAKASDAAKMELIAHGYLAMMHSRRTLLSSYMEHLKRSEKLNDNYHLTIEEATRHEAMPIYEDEHGTHVFSAFVQQSFAELNQFIQDGIGAIRIDGIFHSGEEIVEIVSIYNRLRNGELDVKSAKELFRSAFPKTVSTSGFYYQATAASK